MMAALMEIAESDLRPSTGNETKRLTRDFRRSQRAATIRALLLIAPLLVFLLLVFIAPIAMFLSRSVADTDVARALPSTILALGSWRVGQPVGDAAYAALVSDLRKLKSPPEVADAATRLNYALPGMRALLMSTRSLVQTSASDPRAALTGISPKWNAPATWAAIKQAGGPLTDFYFLASLDLKRGVDGSIERAPAAESAFRPAIERTFEIALGVTALTILFGFPFAYLIATSTERVASILMFVVLLPFWTAIMVRVLSWLVLLGREGIINHALASVDLIHGPLALLYSRFGVYVALVHIFVPFMVLPLYSVMKTVPKSQLRAAASLGARPGTAFRRVYLPQVAPGLAAGALLVFIQCLGVFVVPAILGGPNDQGLPMLIAFYVNKTLNWGLAASLSIVLLVFVYLLYWLFIKLTGSTSPSVG